MIELLEITGNPIPPGVRLSDVTTRDGARLRMASWTSSVPTAGTVILLQGRAEFIEKYFETVSELLGRGFAVVAFDWRGQGRSDRHLVDRHVGHVRRFDDFRLDYEAITAELNKLVPTRAGPVIVLAHSMGGCIALTGALEGWLGADRLVVLSPMIGLTLVRRNGFTRWLARLLSWLGLGSRMVPGGQAASISTLPFDGNRLGRDRRRYDRNATLATALDWGAIGSPSIGWLVAAYEAMARLTAPSAAAGISIPTLILASGDDPVCSTPAIELFARDLKRGRVVVIPEARHEILMETDAIRERFWREFDLFAAGEVPLERAPDPVSG